MKAKSPFYVLTNFLSAKQCEYFSDEVALEFPDTDVDGKPIRMFRFNEELQETVFNKLQTIVPVLEKYYEFDYMGTEQIMAEWYPDQSTSEPQCENSMYLRKKWVRTKTRDITGVLFLSDYQDVVPFDSDYEVYGGKLEFPQHGFGFNPNRGTIVFFPSGPHFINLISPVLAGELYLARVQIAAKKPYLYDPTKFPGNFKNWFQDQF